METVSLQVHFIGKSNIVTVESGNETYSHKH